MEWLYILVIVEKFASAFWCAHIMRKKGRSYVGGWWIGMGLGAFGFIIVCNKSDKSYSSGDEVAYNSFVNGSNYSWKCMCGRINEVKSRMCICGCAREDAVELIYNKLIYNDKKIEENNSVISNTTENVTAVEVKDDEWLCPNCNHANSNDKASCYYCGAIKEIVMYQQKMYGR